ncbi:MAG: hypothetical protein EA382_03255 [Spirochaetaceae bacterium]|nr:MAG: hypothetical protein EA382_03255 [Spirochaetaceae bacterium]
MRKLRVTVVATILLLALSAGIASAQDFDTYSKSIEAFASGVASSLPLNSSIGLNWSHAHIGNFPHLGIGAVVGFSTIPYTAVSPVLEALALKDTLEANENFGYIAEYGMPLPAYAVEARIGGLILPFDVGVKFGAVPAGVDTTNLPGGLSFDYFMAGIDGRLRLNRGRFIVPTISVGGGYNILRASVGLQGLTDGDLTISSFTDPRDNTEVDIVLGNPSVEYFWTANVIDLKAHASWNLLLFTPYVGAGASLGFGSAGGALRSEIKSPNFDDQDWADINAALVAAGEGPLPEFSTDGFSVTADMTGGWAMRLYGGVSVNLFILKVDVTGMYDLVGRNYGLTLGTRIQL